MKYFRKGNNLLITMVYCTNVGERLSRRYPAGIPGSRI